MAGIYPDSGVPANQAANSVDATTSNCSNELFFSTRRCQPRFDPAAANAVISEILNVVNGAGRNYNCNRLDNLLLAIQDMAQAATVVTQTGARNNIFTADHADPSVTDVIWRMPYVTRPTPDVAVVNIYNHGTSEWEEVAVVTPEDVVILNNPTIYIRKDTGSANPPIEEQADLTVANAFNSFSAVRNFMQRTITVGAVTLDVRGDFDSDIGDIGPAQFKNAQVINIIGDPASATAFKVPVGRSTGRKFAMQITGGEVTLRDCTARYYDESVGPGICALAQVQLGKLTTRGTIRFEGFYDVARANASQATLFYIENGAEHVKRDNYQFAFDVGVTLTQGWRILAGGLLNMAGGITYQLQRSATYTDAYFSVFSGASLRSQVAGSTSLTISGAGRGVSPYTAALQPLASASLGGDLYSSRAAVLAYDFGLDVTAGGAQAVFLVDNIAAVNGVAGP